MRSRWMRPAAALAVLAAIGCGGGGPTTYPAGGKVVYPGGEPAPGGVVQFQSPSDSSFSTVGEVGKDGTFTLFTLVDGRKAAGAVAGSYRATVLRPAGANRSGQAPVRSVALPGLYTVRPEGGNDFILLIPRPR